MKQLITFTIWIILICSYIPASAQNYTVIYTPVFDMISFWSIEISGQPRKNMYFQPRGLSGSPCSVLTPENSNLYRILHTGQNYEPFWGMFERFICSEVNMGCYPEPWDIIRVSKQDSDFVIGYMKIDANLNTVNCLNPQYMTKLSTTGGLTTQSLFPNQEVKGFDIDPNNDNNIYFGIIQYLYKSTNRGANFNIISGIQFLNGFIKVNPQNSSIIFAEGTTSMYVSTNAGATFTQLSVPPFNDMAFDSGNNVYGVSSSGVFKSTNKGVTWSQVSSIANVNAVEINPDNPNIIYVGANSGIYRSINGGMTFNQQGYLFPISSKIIGISKDPGTGDTLYASTDKAIYKIFDLATGLSGVTNSTPVQYRLYQNYPNPFNPSTNISFDLPEKSDVSLIIYDGMGRTVTELVNATFITGQYTYSWDAGNLSSGVYFAKLQTEGVSGKVYTDSRKMLLIK